MRFSRLNGNPTTKINSAIQFNIRKRQSFVYKLQSEQNYTTGAPLELAFGINEKGSLRERFRRQKNKLGYFDLLARANFIESFFGFYLQLRNVVLLKDTTQKATPCG
jgi:hypothetical protein